MESVLHVRAFKDNYIWLIRGRSPTHVVIVDPGEAAPVLTLLKAQNLTPVAIFCTHHHGDHSDGITEICQHYPIPAYGPAHEKICGITHPVQENARIYLDALAQEYRVLDIPGHTAGHIAFYSSDRLFCGDTLFSAGCGRLFEGTAAQMHASLNKLVRLPKHTQIYCGHEYTFTNLQFAANVEPDNENIQKYLEKVQNLRALGQPTLPSTLALELQINPFLRVRLPSVRKAVGTSSQRSDTDEIVFAKLRRWKDVFKG